MPLSNRKKERNGIVSIYVHDDEHPEDGEYLVYKINTSKSKIKFFPKEDYFPMNMIMLEGFDKLPSILHENGYLVSGIQYAFAKKLKEAKVKKLTVSNTREASIIKKDGQIEMIMPYRELVSLVKRYRAINAESQTQKKVAVAEVFNSNFPDYYAREVVSDGVRFSRLISNLDGAMVKDMSVEQVETLIDFMARVLNEKYTATHSREKLFRAAKLKFDSVALDEVIDNFKSLMQKRASESAWGKFLLKNLYLVENRYVAEIKELNVILATSRKVDFGLVDTHGFLDLFEIKKPTTKLLANSTDRGNYYWSTDAIKAITQAEKYLYNAERKGSGLAEDIKRELKLDVLVNRPRVVLIMGCSDQLDSDNKKNDFRVLCASLKNVEVVLYDDLLKRIENQRSKTYVSS